MKRKVLSVLVLFLFLSFSCTSFIRADEFKGGSNWAVTFDGSNLKDNFGDREVTELLAGLQPGDSADLEVSIRNSYSKVADFYMNNAVVKSFEEIAAFAEENGYSQYGGYEYELWYQPADGSAEYAIYQSKKVGGETMEPSKKDDDSVGLHEATEELKDFFFLEKIEPGKAGKVRLHVKLDGASQANIYQDTLGTLRLEFAVELPAEGRIFRIPHTGISLAEFPRFAAISKLITGGSMVVMIVSAFILLITGRRKEKAQ